MRRCLLSEAGGGALILSKRDPRGLSLSSQWRAAPRHRPFPGHPEARLLLLAKPKLGGAPDSGHAPALTPAPPSLLHSISASGHRTRPWGSASARALPAPGPLLPSLSSHFRLPSRILLPSLHLSGLVAAWPEGFQRCLTLQPLGPLSLLFNPPYFLCPIPRTGACGVWGPGHHLSEVSIHQQ